MHGIGAYSSSVSHAQLMQEVSTAVTKKTLDSAKAQGDAAVSLLESAAELSTEVAPEALRAEPHKGNLLDVKA